MQSIPADNPAFNTILLSLFQNSSIHNRDQIVNGLMQAMQPNPQQQELQAIGQEMQMRMTEAEINKLLSEAAENNARAVKYQSDAETKVPDAMQQQDKLLKLQKSVLDMENTKADIERKNSENVRNIPEMEHLKSETALNMAKARAEAKKIDIVDKYIQ